MKRYQDCPWYIRLWRRRHYIPVPYRAVIIWWHESRRPLDDEDDWRLYFWQCWRLAISLGQCKMNWVYDMDEVMERLQVYREDEEE